MLKCEMFVSEVLPYLRKELAIILYKKYGMSQIKIAEKLGVTQAAVSQYINNERVKGEYDFNKDEEKVLEKIAYEVNSGKNLDSLHNYFCEICQKRFGQCF